MTTMSPARSESAASPHETSGRNSPDGFDGEAPAQVYSAGASGFTILSATLSSIRCGPASARRP